MSDSNITEYNPAEIEPKWQKFWLDNKTFKVEKTKLNQSSTRWICFLIHQALVFT